MATTISQEAKQIRKLNKENLIVGYTKYKDFYLCTLKLEVVTPAAESYNYKGWESGQHLYHMFEEDAVLLWAYVHGRAQMVPTTNFWFETSSELLLGAEGVKGIRVVHNNLYQRFTPVGVGAAQYVKGSEFSNEYFPDLYIPLEEADVLSVDMGAYNHDAGGGGDLAVRFDWSFAFMEK